MGYQEISGKHLRFCGGTSSGVTAQNILISRVSIQERYLLSHSGISPLATIRTFRFNKLNPKGLSWRPHFVQFWCGRAICRRQMMKRKKQVDEKVNMCQIPQSIVVASARYCGYRRKALWLKPNRDFSSVRLWTAASLAAQKKKQNFFNLFDLLIIFCTLYSSGMFILNKFLLLWRQNLQQKKYLNFSVHNMVHLYF